MCWESACKCECVRSHVVLLCLVLKYSTFEGWYWHYCMPSAMPASASMFRGNVQHNQLYQMDGAIYTHMHYIYSSHRPDCINNEIIAKVKRVIAESMLLNFFALQTQRAAGVAWLYLSAWLKRTHMSFSSTEFCAESLCMKMTQTGDNLNLYSNISLVFLG